MSNPVKTTTLKVVESATEVKINHEKIEELAREWSVKQIIIPSWPKEMHLETKDEKTMLDYLVVLDTLNFCFWPSFVKIPGGRIQKERWSIKYNGRKYNGYFALSLALKEYFEKIRND